MLNKRISIYSKTLVSLMRKTYIKTALCETIQTLVFAIKMTILYRLGEDDAMNKGESGYSMKVYSINVKSLGLIRNYNTDYKYKDNNLNKLDFN